MGKPELLKSAADFQAFRVSKSYQSETLRIRVRNQANQNNLRFGFIIPKKQVAHATDRNLLKRRLKAIVLKLAPQLKPVDVLFFPKAQALKKPFADLEMEMVNLFQKARIWK